jgi:hypothetical protein
MVFLLSASGVDVNVVSENGVDDDDDDDESGDEEESCCRFPFVFLLFDTKPVSLF